jgi:protein MpaA
MLGRSEQGRPIDAIRVGNPKGTRVLVFGCIHGTECAGIAIARALEQARTKLDLWIVPNLNPDGYARGSRQNGRGVDLNANWSAQWHGGGRPWDVYYPGPRPFSERETRIARNLILRIRPVVTIWYHQHMNLVWAWGQSSSAGRIYADAARMHFYHHHWLNSTATNWQNHHLPDSAAFTVELPAGSLTPQQVRRHVHAVLVVAAAACGRTVSSAGRPKTAARQSSGKAGPGFRPSAGWHILENGLSAPPTESAATAANVPFAAGDRSQPTATPTPIKTVAHLLRDGIVIWAQFVPRGSHPRIDKNFPPAALPLARRPHNRDQSARRVRLPTCSETSQMLQGIGLDPHFVGKRDRIRHRGLGLLRHRPPLVGCHQGRRRRAGATIAARLPRGRAAEAGRLARGGTLHAHLASHPLPRTAARLPWRACLGPTHPGTPDRRQLRGRPSLWNLNQPDSHRAGDAYWDRTIEPRPAASLLPRTNAHGLGSLAPGVM